jgi:hypothetical protein
MTKQFREELEYISTDSAKHFQSHDLGLVAFLLCSGCEMEAMDKSKPNKVLFILKAQNDIDELAKSYWNFRSTVDAQSYFNQLKRLKNQIFSYD